jgi:hypothetical protein
MKNMKDQSPPISKELINYLKQYFKMPTHTLDKDLRELDFISGQMKVIEFMEAINKKQNGE